MKNKKNILTVGLIITVILVVLAVNYINNYQIKKEISRLTTENILTENNEIELSSLTLKQKIAQMIVVRGDRKNMDFTRLNVGGIFLDRQNSEEAYKNLIEEYQKEARIKLFVTTDLEGTWTPFHEQKPHQVFPYFSKIETAEQAYDVGLGHGKLLKEVGFNLNFAPVSELSDKVYGGRVFPGTKEEVKEKIKEYIQGLQENVLGTCKHYPGKAMEKNLHAVSDRQTITEEDLELFDVCLENNISSIMVSHQIVTGVLDSKGNPSSVSKEIVSTINDSILIIADEINMAGLKEFYPDKTEMYVDLINSGEDLILDFRLNSVRLYEIIKNIEQAVEQGKISEEEIDKSVRKILIKKGYTVT
jgi:beta-N-acetylhexosaminidase